MNSRFEPPEDLKTPFHLGNPQRENHLFSEVRHASLPLDCIQSLLEQGDQEGIWKVIYQELQTGTDPKRILFLLYDPARKVLVEKPVREETESSGIHNLEISVKMEKSLVVKSFRQQKPLDTISLPSHFTPVIVDEQIMRFLGSQGMFCLPMVACGEGLGVIVLGLEKTELPSFSKQLEPLNLFIRLAAFALYLNHLRQMQLKPSQSDPLREAFAIARKLTHDRDNPLGIIKNRLRILSEQLSENSLAQVEIEIINKEIDRATEIVRDLAAFAEGGGSEKEPVVIHALLSDLVKIKRESLFRDSKIKLHLDLEPSASMVLAERNRIEEALHHIIENATEAMAGGGNLHIQTKRLSPVERNWAGHDQGSLEIIFRDEGIGIPEEIKSRLFDPFVSSKGKGHAGVGLSIVRDVIEELQGRITYESERGRGTVFKIELPLVAARHGNSHLL